MSDFNYTATPLQGLYLIERGIRGDARGFLSRFYCADSLAKVGFDKPIAQINHTLTKRQGCVRGLHFQMPPYAEMKMVSCLVGEIWDVAVDLRQNSPTFLQWHAEILSADNHKSLLIPEGFAHGFQTLSDDCELIYLHSCNYHPEAEAALNVYDPRLNISWPLPISELSERDQQHPFINQMFAGVALCP